MKRLSILTSLTALLSLTSVLQAQEAHKIWEPPYSHGIAAAVEDSIITFEELRRELLPLVPRVREGTQNKAEFDTQMSELYFEVLQSLVDRVLIMKDFKEKEFNLPPSLIENEFDKVLFEDFDNDRGKFHEFLKSQGKNVREFRRELYEQIIVSIMRSQKQRTASQISPERIENFYNENKLHFYEDEAVKLRIITMRPIAGESIDLMRQNIEKVLAEIDSGTPFEDVAKEHSQDSRRERGGDWGWIQRGDLKEELAVPAFALVVGEHSEPIDVDNQTMILFVEDYREEGIQDLVEVRDNIEEILSSQLGRQTQEQWLERLRKKAYIRYF
jgi:peptidyl-prolyl cis-trans isomerase SurA|tara:strand:+ start:122 stop:1108 length:987 start_codon:yes stop_codon:yes gene_type:complete